MRHNRIQPVLQYGCVALRMRFFSQNFGTIKRILPGSSSLSHREGPGTEVGPKLERLSGGGDEYSYSRVTSDVFLSKSTLTTTDFNRNLSGRMRCSSLW